MLIAVARRMPNFVSLEFCLEKSVWSFMLSCALESFFVVCIVLIAICSANSSVALCPKCHGRDIDV